MTDHLPRIVVGYDGSASAGAALDWAAEWAELQADEPHEVRAVIVGTAMDPVLGGYRARNDDLLERWRSEAEQRLAGTDTAPGQARERVEVRHGPVVPELLRAAEQAAMLVVGSDGHGLATGTLTGSVSQHVARHAGCPVVVVRPRRSTVANRIVVGIDESPEAGRALRFACRRAQRTGESVIAVHGCFSVLAHVLTFDGAESELAARSLAAGERLVQEVCAARAPDFPDVEIEPEAIPVRPGQVLVDASRAASLVVVGSRGRDAFAELLLGSVSQHVLHHAHCPVAIVR
ncbi:universal stress protein [Nocardioides humi]|uniref:Universal stress protein n=1 Tax=Nocardioides humi TaxID=449461 RepID=A0ABN2BLP7_9ACTN|nr:universal stress protein [Nocardioides humi]